MEDFQREFSAAIAAGELTTLVAKVDAVGPSGYVTDLSLLENRYQFQRYLRDRKTPQPHT
jgi:sulfopyruvate decarboxylase subunit beta